jgi:hypothetical protein
MPLLEADETYLKENGYIFDVTDETRRTFLVIKDYKLPASYSPQSVDLLIILPFGFPNANPDMFWTDPRVIRSGGQMPQAADVFETYLGKSWLRWSRHWSVPWRPGIDGLNTYLAAISKELSKGI